MCPTLTPTLSRQREREPSHPSQRERESSHPSQRERESGSLSLWERVRVREAESITATLASLFIPLPLGEG
jgi:hypothetical protein